MYGMLLVLFGLVAALLGLVTAASGLMSRYTDDPSAAIKSRPGVVYLAINAGLAIIAFAVLVLTSDVKPPRTADEGWGGASLQLLKLAVFAGLGAVLLLRVQFSFVFQGEQRAIGPGTVIDAVLATIDTAIDRQRALLRADLVAAQMGTIDFDKAKVALPLLVSGARKSISADQQARLGTAVKAIEQANCSGALKSYSLGFALLDVTGEQLFKQLLDKYKSHFDLGDGPGSDGAGGTDEGGGGKAPT